MLMETERLMIDGLTEADREDFFRCIAHDRKVLETFICRYAETLDDFDYAPYIRKDRVNSHLLAIRLKETGRMIGLLVSFDETEEACEIGYALGSVYWGQGLATEAVGRFIQYLMGEKGLKTVRASFFTGNEASRRVMEKCGMTYSHMAPGAMTYLGRERDLTYYSLTKEERA